MKKFIGRILMLCACMVVFTACPAEFVNPLKKNVDVTLKGLLGDWQMDNMQLTIRESLLEGNYFVDYVGDVNNDESKKYTFRMHVTKINQKYYATLVNNDSENIKYNIAEFRNWGAFLAVKMLDNNTEMMNYSNEELFDYIKSNQNQLTYQTSYSYDFERQ